MTKKLLKGLMGLICLFSASHFLTACHPDSKLNGISKTANLTFFNARPVPTNAYRILFVGDSLTLHGAVPKVWDYFSGMAATSPEKDFAHLFASRMQSRMTRPVEVFYAAAGPLSDTIDQIQSQPRLAPDLVVFQGGENDKFDEAFKVNYRRLLSSYTNTPAKAIVLGDWWSAEKSQFDQSVAKEFNFPFVEIITIQAQAENKGYGGAYNFPGVSAHPNDKGMGEIAKALEDKISN